MAEVTRSEKSHLELPLEYFSIFGMPVSSITRSSDGKPQTFLQIIVPLQFLHKYS